MFVVMFQSFSSIPSTFMGKMSGDQWHQYETKKNEPRRRIKEMDKFDADGEEKILFKIVDDYNMSKQKDLKSKDQVSKIHDLSS